MPPFLYYDEREEDVSEKTLSYLVGAFIMLDE
jgi:hypothetical protein